MVESQREMATQKDRDEARYKRLVNSTKPFLVNKDTSREKPLFGRGISVATITERGSSGQSQRDGEIGDGTLPSRIPRRSSYSPDIGNSLSKKSSAGVVSLAGAYNRALKEEEQENSHIPNPGSSPLSKGAAGRVSIAGAYISAVEDEHDIFRAPEKQGSPSPAPRPRIRSQESDEKRMAAIRRGFIRPVTAPISETRHGITNDDDATTGSEGSLSDPAESVAGSNDSTIERKLDQYEKDAALRDKIIHGRLNLNRNSSGSSMEDGPGVAKSGSWGSKARLGSSWMRKIISPDHSGDIRGAEEEPSVNFAVAGPDVPVSSVEDDTSIQEPTPPHSRPSSAQPNTTSPLKSQIWDAELDFTAKSLAGYGTSPQLNIRSSKITEITAREIETLSKRAVATSRLEEIRERNSESPELNRSPSREFPKRSSPTESSSTRENSSSLRRKESEASLRKQSSEESSPESADTNSNELPSRSSLGHTRSLTRDEIAAALKPTTTKTKLRRTSSSKESWELLGTSHGELTERSTPELTEEVEKELNCKDKAQPSLEGSKTRSSSKESTSVISPSKPQGSEEQFYERTILEEEGEHIPGTPITIFYGAAKEQSNHKRGESWQNLQNLAKALSVSPGVPSEEQKPKEESKADSSKLKDFVPVDAKRLSTTSTSPKSDVDPEERIAAEASLFDLPENNKSERNSLRAPSPDYYPHDPDETPRPKRDPLSMPTPVVTGAYIETPATARQSKKPITMTGVINDGVTNPDTARLAANIAIKELVRGSNSESSQTRGLSSRSSRNKANGPLSSHPIDCTPRPKSASRFRPPLINTANPSSAAEDLRRIQQEAQIEDSTLDDFGDLLEASDDSDVNSPVDLESNERGRPLSDLERERRKEALAYERLNKGLKNGLLSIRDAKRGIERLEDRVSSSLNPAVTILQNDKTESQSLASQDSSTVVYFAIPIPRLWIWTNTKKWGVRPTRLGLIIGLMFGWLLAETITCEYVCKPTYASVNNWSPGDPLWGMALPTLTNRMTGGFLVIISKFGREFIDWVWSVWSGAAETRKTATLVAKKVWSSWDSGSMFEDERV